MGRRDKTTKLTKSATDGKSANPLSRITCYPTRLVLLTARDVLIADNRRFPAEELGAYCRRRFAAFPHPRAESGVFQVGLLDFLKINACEVAPISMV